ncbi:hypothetical protein [Catalinimonas alkaloidigena]|uniref:hypothetical protein n=1 Tax=Catalinimonas alkaloidigena TaxID=1075417 RepID=UPI001C409D57|nr:hypothetical protein [Catalinimonas alkaloidigena]
MRYHLTQIDNAHASGNRFQNGVALENYQALNQLAEAIRLSPGALAVIPQPNDYHREVNDYRNRAAAERYAAGEAAMKLGHRQGYIEAYDHFQMAQSYAPGYKDVTRKIDEARYLATVKVLVEQVPVPSVNYQLSIEFFQDQVDQFLMNYRENEFVQFVSPREQIKEGPDQIIQIRIDDFMVGQTNNFSDSKEFTRDSVVVGQVKLDNGEDADVYGTVKANFIEYRQEIKSNGLVTMRILDGRTRQVLVHEKYPGEFVWVSQWANYKGDERALSKDQLKLTRLRPQTPPPPQQMFIEFCKPIYGQLQSRVRNYYARL